MADRVSYAFFSSLAAMWSARHQAEGKSSSQLDRDTVYNTDLQIATEIALVQIENWWRSFMKSSTISPLARLMHSNISENRDKQTQMQVYAYKTLKLEQSEIRLLVLEPGTKDDPIKCSLKRTPLSTAAAGHGYETISYTWGDASLQVAITIDGDLKDVPVSAETVLRRLRLPDKSRTLWLDAVCINQGDNNERSHQVNMMADIYSSATSNLIWLGDEDETTEAALKSINSLADEVDLATRSTRLFDVVYKNNAPWYGGLGFTSSIDKSAIAKFFARPWFTRKWIIQEAALAQANNCYCGPFEIPLRRILQAAIWLRHNWDIFEGDDKVLLFHIHRAGVLFDWTDRVDGCCISLRNHLDSTLLPRVLMTLRWFAASDPRDHVFAIAGLFREASMTGTVPSVLSADYEVTLKATLIKVNRWVIVHRKDLNIFRNILDRRPEGETEEMPSWLVRWDMAWDWMQDCRELELLNNRADGRVEVMVDENTPDHLLSVRGFILDEVVTTLVFPDKHESPSLLSFVLAAETASVHEATADQDEIALVLTLQTGTTASLSPADPHASVKAYRDYKEFLKENDLPPQHKADMSEKHKEMANFSQAMHNGSVARAFFTTTKGRIGVGPKPSQAGDIVVILYGSWFPVVLRKSEKHLGTYQVLGQCYVYGVMDGSATERHKASGEADMVFELS